MATATTGTTYHRPARTYPDPVPTAPIVIAAPPIAASAQKAPLLQALLPVLGSLSLVAFAIVYDNPLFFVIAGALAGLSLVTALALRFQQGRAAKRERKANAERYAAHLAERERELAAVATAQRAADQRLYPDPASLWASLNAREHLWERRREDRDFCHVCVGRGDVPLAAPVELDLGHNPLVEHEPDLLARARELLDAYATLSLAPVVVDLASLGSVAVSGQPAKARALVHALILQLAAASAPDDVRIVAHFPAEAADQWDWLKWLPHTRASGAGLRADEDTAPVATDLTSDPDVLAALLEEVVRPRAEQLARDQEVNPNAAAVSSQHVVVVLAGFDPTGPVALLPVMEEVLRDGAELHMTTLCLLDDPSQAPSRVGARIDVSEAGWLSFRESGPEGSAQREILAEAAEPPLCDAVARTLAPIRLGNRRGRTDTVESDRLLDLLGLGGPEGVDPSRTWARRTGTDLLRVPFGVRVDGEPVELDLKESAEDGMGPHGLLVGATGSGKSELLRTLVTALAITHPPDLLNFVFVDFKGGAAFADLAALPHTAGIITNLQRDLTMVDRMYDALFGEQERRQQLLLDAGNLDDIRAYQAKLAEDGRDRPEAMPYLLIVVDEFGELLASRPDFLDLFVTVGRTGRSLGMHLLLASQRLDEGRIRSLEGHLRYRICLRTFSPEESQSVLGTRDAFGLPPLPGLGYFKVDNSYTRFKSALVTAPWRPTVATEPAPAVIRPFETAPDGQPEIAPAPVAAAAADDGADSEMQVAITAMTAEEAPAVPPAHQVWLPPLPEALPLDAVIGAEAVKEPLGWLRIAVGLLDRPREQTQESLVLDFSGAGGHLAIVGAPQTGKSTLLRTIVAGFALTHSPDDVQVYGIDLGGGGLHALEGLPHVGSITSKSDRDKIERTVREMSALIEQRALDFRRHGIDSIAEYHRRRHAGELPDARYGEVFLIVDNWALLRQEFEDLETEIAEVVSGGLHYGVHVIVASNRWADIRAAVRDNIGGRLELRLNDPLESEVDRKVAETLPEGVAGRGLTRAALHFQAALPRIDGQEDAVGLPAALEQLIEAAAWPSAAPAAPIRMLPFRVSPSDLADPEKDPVAGVAIGLEEFGLEPVHVDLGKGDPHFLVFGDAECGKSNLLRVWIEAVKNRYVPEEMQLAVVDFARSLLDVADGPHIRGYAVTPQMATDMATELTTELTTRLPTAELTREELMARRWWSGPEVTLIVDDYDLVASPAGNPLGGLVDLLAQGRDIGFHVLIARRVGGSARSAYEPFFQRVRELGSPGLIMDGDPQEGILLGNQKALPLPPGRGFLVRRQRRTALVQTVLLDPVPQVPADDAQGGRE